MERPKTQTEARQERFDKLAQACRDLSDTALRDIDAVLAEQGVQNEQRHTLVEQNGTDVSEEDLAWEAFNQVFHRS